MVLIKDHRIPDTYPKITHFAHHTSIEFRERVGEPWKAIEIPNPDDGVVLRTLDRGRGIL